MHSHDAYACSERSASDWDVLQTTLSVMSHPARGYRWPITAEKLTRLSTPSPICQNGSIERWYPTGTPSQRAGIGDDMVRREKTVRHVGAFQFEHPVLHFIFVRPIVWIGKVWLHLLVGKEHLLSMASPAPLRRLTYFGPASHPLLSSPAPILVIAPGRAAGGRSESAPIGDIEPSVERHV